MNVTILNGPPGCGKDTLAEILCARHPALHKSFKDFLYSAVGDYLKVDPEDVKARCADRDTKELPWIQGKSVREWLIHVSEDICKPLFGDDYFGVRAAEDWHGYYAPIVVSDGGFPAEIQAVCNKFRPENVLVIQLHREGYDFSGDSREYINDNDVPCNVLYVQLVEGEIESAYDQIQALRKEFFK